MLWVICNGCLASTIGNVVEQEGNTVVDREGSESNLIGQKSGSKEDDFFSINIDL